MGRFLGYEREAVTRFAFLLAIPAVVGAGLFELQRDPARRQHVRLGPDDRSRPSSSFVVGYAAIAWLLRYVSHHTLAPFVVYRVLLGAGVIALLAAGVLSA